jgi:hypothetical protein
LQPQLDRRAFFSGYQLSTFFQKVQDYETGLNGGDNETWCTGFNNDNYRKTGRLNGDQIVELTPIRDSQTGVADPLGRFGSAHPNDWNASFCDGSVQTISYDIDWQVHRDLGNRTDGNVAEVQDQ